MAKNEKLDFLIFGATGMQGNIVTRDLIEGGYGVALSGFEENKLKVLGEKHPPAAGLYPVDLRQDGAARDLAVRLAPKVIVNCAEGDWNIEVYEAALASGAHVIDLGSDVPTTRQQTDMHGKFRDNNLTAITGCGSTPGINNVMLSYARQFFDSIDTVEAGFAWNSNMQSFVVPFSMESILEEFTDPAPVVENGIWKEVTPLQTVKDEIFRGAGVQKTFLVRHPETETFYSSFKKDGLRTVRFFAGFPEHSFNKIMSYIGTEAFSKKEGVQVEGVGTVPLAQLTGRLQELFPPPDGYRENENLWVRITGSKDGAPLKVVMECLVPTLDNWVQAGCNIDTGFPASVIAQFIANGNISERGSFAPENVVPQKLFFDEIKRRGMTILKDGVEVA